MFFLALPQNENYTLKPDGFSYIIYSVYPQIATYYNPSLDSINLKADTASKFFIVKCRPTYVRRLHENNLGFNHGFTSREFLNHLESEEFKNIFPTPLDTILFHLHFKKGNTSLENLKYRYQCSAASIEADFKDLFGFSFAQYQKILLHTT